MSKFRENDRVVYRKDGKTYTVGNVLEPKCDGLPTYYDLKGTLIYVTECQLRMAPYTAQRVDGQIHIGDGR